MKNSDNQVKVTRAFTYSLYLYTGGFAFAFMISGVLVNHIIEHFGLTGAGQGYMNSMINIGNTIAILLTIIVYFRLKKTTMLFLCGLLIVVTLTMTGLAGSFLMVLVVSLALGFGLGWFDSYVNSCVVDANPVGSMKYMSTMHGFYGVGALLAPIVIAALLTVTDWQGVYLSFAPLVLITVIIYVVTLRYTNKRILISGMESPKFTRSDLKIYLKDKRLVLLLAALFFYSLMQFGLFTWLVRYMSVQYDAETLGMTGITLMWVGTTLSRFIAPRLPVESIKLYSFGAAIAGVTLFIGVFSGNPYVMCAMVGLSSLASGLCLPALINKSVEIYQGSSLLPTSAMLLTTRIAGILTPPTLGWISVTSMQASMVVPIIAIIVSAALGFMLTKVQRRKQYI